METTDVPGGGRSHPITMMWVLGGGGDYPAMIGGQCLLPLRSLLAPPSSFLLNAASQFSRHHDSQFFHPDISSPAGVHRVGRTSRGTRQTYAAITYNASAQSVHKRRSQRMTPPAPIGTLIAPRGFRTPAERMDGTGGGAHGGAGDTHTGYFTSWTCVPLPRSPTCTPGDNSPPPPASCIAASGS